MYRTLWKLISKRDRDDEEHKGKKKKSSGFKPSKETLRMDKTTMESVLVEPAAIKPGR